MKERIIRCHPVTLVLMRTWIILSPDIEARYPQYSPKFTGRTQAYGKLSQA